MDWLIPDGNFTPPLRSLADHRGRRLVFTIGGLWQRHASYRSREDYEAALDILTQGALRALDGRGQPERVGVSMAPSGSLWVEWLLPMQFWKIWARSSGVRRAWGSRAR